MAIDNSGNYCYYTNIKQVNKVKKGTEMKERYYAKGSYPTMITPYKEDGTVDYEAAEKLVEWYWKEGCDGIFAVCQSSEIWYLNEEERVSLANVVCKKAAELAEADTSRPPMTIVASGHVSEKMEDQIRELNRIAESGADAVILITNRMDIDNTSDENWIRDAETILENLPADVTLGLYECPVPYKRLLTPKILEWCLSTGRFRFIKDTCCDADEIERRMQILRGTDLLLFNANAQTLYASMKSGAAGFCGIMANFQPAVFSWLTHHMDDPRASVVGSFLSISAFTESLAYPVSAKYNLSVNEGIPMTIKSRSCDPERLTDYQKMCVNQLHELTNEVKRQLGIMV